MITDKILAEQCIEITKTLSILAEHYGENFKLSYDKADRKKYEKHLKLLGSVGLVNEFVINDKDINVTVAPDTLGFYCFNLDHIKAILKDGFTYDGIFKAFNKMFPQDKDHCSKCCSYDYDDGFGTDDIE